MMSLWGEMHVMLDAAYKQGAGMLHTGRSCALQEINIALVQMKSGSENLYSPIYPGFRITIPQPGKYLNAPLPLLQMTCT